MRESWVVGYLFDIGAVDRHLADLVERFVFLADAETAGHLASSIELKVAPPSGGLSACVGGVVAAVVANLPTMGASVRPCAVALLTQIAGSLLHVDPAAERDVVKALVDALPGVAALAQHGDAELQADFVDLAALCAALDRSAARQVAFYLKRIVDEVGGDVGASAQAELEQLAAS
ncbi:MAG: hypothetical protein M3500_04555 [Actinomycetota bacterium]|jgi:hypothetical protein|nr:hypothetical protein [Actinomycetota bacterium]